MPDPLDARLARVRGTGSRLPHTARTIAALANNPGCRRRAVVDAAGVDKLRLAAHIGFPARFGQSPFAIVRGNAFEAQVKDQECSGLVRLFQETLGLRWDDVRYVNLEKSSAGEDSQHRHTRSLNALRRCLDTETGPTTIFDHPLLCLDVAGSRCFLEPDLLVSHDGRFRLVEIKSFAVIDGQADGGKVAAAAVQAAAYLLALRQTLGTATLVPPEVVLVCPENFSNQPTASVIDIRKQILILEHQLRRLARISSLLDELPDDLTLDLAPDPAGNPGRPAAQVVTALRSLSARYRPDCLEYCEFGYFCREEAAGRTAALGVSVREALGGVESVAEVLALAAGGQPPTEGQAEVAALLRAASTLYAEAFHAAEASE